MPAEFAAATDAVAGTLGTGGAPICKFGEPPLRRRLGAGGGPPLGTLRGVENEDGTDGAGACELGRGGTLSTGWLGILAACSFGASRGPSAAGGASGARPVESFSSAFMRS